MRQGYRVIDVDTHVTPSSEVLLRYADQSSSTGPTSSMPFTRRTKPVAGAAIPTTSTASSASIRIPSSAWPGASWAPPTTARRSPAPVHAAPSKDARRTRRPRPVHDNIQHDNPEGRLLDMDVEGVDIDLIIPGTWAPGQLGARARLGPVDAPCLPPVPARLHERRHAPAQGGHPRPRRATRNRPPQDILELAAEDWVAGVWPVLPEGSPSTTPTCVRSSRR